MPRPATILSVILAAAALAACASGPPQPPARPTPPIPPARVEPPTFTLAPSAFADLPGWAELDARPALEAFARSCAAIARRPDDQRLGRFAPYGGLVGDWRGPCADLPAAADAVVAKRFFEARFTPHEVIARPDQMAKVTGYFEPIITASRTPQPGREEPFLPRPDDLVGIDLAAFDEAQDLSEGIAEDVRKGLSNDMAEELKALVEQGVDERLERRFVTPIWGRLTKDRRIVPYPERRALRAEAANPLGFAHPADVYDAQVQGSARVRFIEDGAMMRMAYAAQNGWRWNSAWACLRDRGDIARPIKAAAKTWMDAQGPAAAGEALACDPSYVFFALESIDEPAAGPKGAQGVPLTALGSVAVDPAAHPYGAVLFLAGEGPGTDGRTGPQARLVVAQDTGGAIRRGPLRADLFYGVGETAGALALQQNAPARFWTLLPRQAAAAATIAAP